MKRSSSVTSDSPVFSGAVRFEVSKKDTQSSPRITTREQRPTLTEDSAGQQAEALLNHVPPKKQEFARLLDDMHEDGIQKLKLSGTRLSAQGYEVLLGELRQPFRLRDQIHELDFSSTELPQISSLLNIIANNCAGRLRSLNLANTHFPRSRAGEYTNESRIVGLQPDHLTRITEIVAANKDLSYLNLNYQDLLGSTQPRTQPGSYQRDAPVYRLMEVCLTSRIEVLKLQHCELSDLDLSDIRDMLHNAAQSGQTSLRELHLQGNDIGHAHDCAKFIQGLNAHPSLEYLGLPAMAHDQYKQLDKHQKLAVAQALEACPRLSRLEPATLVNEPEIRAVLSTRLAELRQAQLTNAVLV